MPSQDSPGTTPSPASALEALKNFVAQFDPVDLLSQLTLTFLFTQETTPIGESSPVRLWARWIEFIAGYLATRPIGDEQYARFHGSSIETLEALVKEYFNSLLRQFLAERSAMGQTTPAERLLMSAKIHSLYVRGDAYPHQFLEYASELYGEHDRWFKSNLGFTINDAIQIVRAIPVELERRVNESATRAKADAPGRAETFLEAGEEAGLSRRELEIRIACDLHFGAARQLLSFTVEEISQISGAGLNVCKAFLNRLSQPFGYRNPRFPNTYGDASKAPWDYNCVDERPFLEHENRYWLFTNPMLTSVIFYTFYYDLMADVAYRPRFEASRGAYVERKVRNYATRVFPTETVLLNPTYSNGQEFSDVAVLYDGKVVIFQCKAKGLARSARIGENFVQLRADMQAGIRTAFDQALRARKYLRDSEKAILGTEGAELHVETKHITDIYLINVTFMPFHTMATRFENIEDALGLFPEKEYPLSLSLGALDIVSQLLDSPARFLHYVNRRLAIEKTAFDLDADELDLLGYYLFQGLYFTPEEVRGASDVALTGFSEEIDEYVHRKYDAHQEVERPQTPMPPGFSELISDIESLPSMYRTDCAIALLDMGGPARSKIMELIETTKSMTRKDNGQHSISLDVPDQSRGFSFLSIPNAGSEGMGFEAATSFAMLKKYAQKLDEWFGLGWRLGSSRSVDVAVTLRFAWEKDDVMEKAVKRFLTAGRKIDPR
ncbi:MAG: hypothetical protein LAN63_07080 [Acidobacteriia bacterium]|nr:hypothetical protein [Terriglobia bacterium]